MKVRQRIGLGMLACLLVLCQPAMAEVLKIKPGDVPTRVLFVGNSFSYFNDGLHNHYANLIRAAGEYERGHRYRLKTISGGKLREHEGGLTALLDNPENRQFQYVVLQGFSNAPITPRHKAAFHQSASNLAGAIRAVGAEPALFMTWAYKDEPDMTQRLADEYLRQGSIDKALVVPVGLAFANALSQHPSIELYVADVDGFDEQGNEIYKPVIKHPSMAGTYLAACVFYATFQQRSPEGLPYLAGLDKATANALQSIAWQTVTAFYADQQD